MQKVTDIQTSFDILSLKKHQPFIMKGLLGSGFLENSELSFFWSGKQFKSDEWENFENKERFVKMTVTEAAKILMPKAVVPESMKNDVIIYKLVKSNFKAMLPSDIVLPAFTETEVGELHKKPSFVEAFVHD